MKNNLIQEPFIWVDFEISDFEQFEKVVQDWSIDFYQLDGASFHSKLEQMILPQIQIGQTHFDCHIDQKGKSPENMWTFVIMGKNSSMFNFNHEKTKTTSTMVIYSPGQKINAVSHSGFHIYVFSIEQTYFKSITSSLKLDKMEEKLRKIDRIELTFEQASLLRDELKNLLELASSMDEKLITTKEKELFVKLLPIKIFKNIHAHIGCTPKKIFKNKYLSYMDVRAYMHTHLKTTLNIEDISKKFNLSDRTLRNYFKDELNLSPKQYLNIIRLQKIRDIILRQNENFINIEQTARKYGFNHMGQFSANYKEFFGELPSQSLIITE